MITFLNTIKTIDRREIAAKASKVILNAYFEDLQPTVRNLSNLKHPEKLASSGFVVHGFITPDAYADKLLSPDHIPTTRGMRSPLLFALNLVSRRQLVPAFAEELQHCFSLPKLTTHAGRQHVSGT